MINHPEHKITHEWKSVTEFAALRNCSRQYIQRLCVAGKIKGAKKVGSYWIIPIETPPLPEPNF